jgi:hypothetical protein
MIPLYWFLFVWLILMALFCVAALLTVMLAVKYGLSSFTTFISTVLFLGVSVTAIIITGIYLLGADWTQGLNIFGNVTDVLRF